MNERILELAQQAGITTNLETDFFGKDPNEWVDYFSEKFAELIIRECIDIVSPYAIRMENFDGGHPIMDLKKHFGIE